MTMPPKPYTARVIAIDDISSDIRVLRVELDNKQRLPFEAGQYVFLEAAGCDPRPFSIATTPHDVHIEFHVRNSGHGISAHAFEKLNPGSALTLMGPFGTNIWRGDDRALLLLAGGIGIAPLKSIVETHLRERSTAPVTLYWGVREKEQLYLDAHFRELAKKHPRFSYIPVLSHDEDDRHFRKGFPATAAAEDHETLHGLSIYMAGPRAMIDASLPVLEKKNAEKEHIFSDAFSP